MNNIKCSVLILLFFSFLWISGTAFAQDPDEMLLREYVNPDEVVSIAPDTPFRQALHILSDFTQEFDNRVIINRSAYTGPINVNVSNMYWRRALLLIARVNNLVVNQDREAYEIRSIADSPEQAEREVALQRTTDLPADLYSREVEISAIFFEGNRRTLRELGIDWSAVTTDGRVRVNNIGAAQVSDEIFTVGLNLSNGMIPNMDILALFNALESANQGEILSSPRVKVIEGREGRIQVGQDISIKQRDIAGNVIDQFVNTGTILRVTPLIITEDGYDFIYLTIAAERSSGTPSTVSTIISKQEAQSELLLLPGETAVIAGLYETEKSTVRRGIPFLKDLPGWFFGLKYIFGYNSTELIQNELVIVLKADIVDGLQQRAQHRFRSMPEMLDHGRRSIILDREIGSGPGEPIEELRINGNAYRSAPEIPVNPVMVENDSARSGQTSENSISETNSAREMPRMDETKVAEPSPEPARQFSPQPFPNEQNAPVAESEANDNDSETVTSAQYGLYGIENNPLEGAYTIVLHSLSNENRSRTEKRSLEELGYKAIIWQVTLPGGQTTWRTGVGQFRTEEEAEVAASQLPDTYQRNHFITRIE